MNRAFSLAWFFHVSPAETLALPVDDLIEWEQQALRIKRTHERPPR